MYDDICYSKTFLKEVIFKVDFASPLMLIGDGLPQGLTKEILNILPISEPRQAESQEVQLSESSITSKSTKFMEWVFHGASREKTLTITPTFISYSTRDYTSYEELVADINTILEAFFRDVQGITIARSGLRYINVLEHKDSNPLSWKNYINEEMLGIIDFHGDESLTRAFHILGYNFDGLSLTYQFGIANPDFPAVIRRKQFVLDLDAYSHGSFELADIKTFMTESHGKIQTLFEKSITDVTRDLMGDSDG